MLPEREAHEAVGTTVRRGGWGSAAAQCSQCPQSSRCAQSSQCAKALPTGCISLCFFQASKSASGIAYALRKSSRRGAASRAVQSPGRRITYAYAYWHIWGSRRAKPEANAGLAEQPAEHEEHEEHEPGTCMAFTVRTVDDGNNGNDDIGTSSVRRARSRWLGGCYCWVSIQPSC